MEINRDRHEAAGRGPGQLKVEDLRELPQGTSGNFLRGSQGTPPKEGEGPTSSGKMSLSVSWTTPLSRRERGQKR